MIAGRIIVGLAAVVLAAVASLPSLFGLPPVEYWFDDPSDYSECVEAGGHVEKARDKARCTFRDTVFRAPEVTTDDDSEDDDKNTTPPTIDDSNAGDGDGDDTGDGDGDDGQDDPPEPEEVKAFPGAEGFGADALGGRGGEVIYVTNLNDSGTGSLRACVEASGPRYCLFKTGGTIDLKKPLNISNPFITIAGQSAPGGGIALRNSGSVVKALVFIDTHDVVMRHIRVRPGPDTTSGGSANLDAIAINGGHDIILDHVSASWGVDEIVGAWADSQDITWQWSIFSEGLLCSNHQKTVNESLAAGDTTECPDEPGGGHSRGSVISTGFDSTESPDRISIHHNLWAHAQKRFPNITSDTFVDVVNNVMYNFADFATKIGPKTLGWTSRANFINNYYKPGPSTKSGTRVFTFDSNEPDDVQIYWEGNTVISPLTQSTDGTHAAFFVDNPFSAPSITTTSADIAFDEVLDSAGATLPSRDVVDVRIVREVRNGTGTLADKPEDVGGWPILAAGVAPTDSDGDGMPDSWEENNGFNPNIKDGSGDVNGDGYTNLEEYLNSM